MIEVLTTGPQNTVQDLGRSLYRNIGVAISGAMDGLALRVGNRLLGNPDAWRRWRCRPSRCECDLAPIPQSR